VGFVGSPRAIQMHNVGMLDEVAAEPYYHDNPPFADTLLLMGRAVCPDKSRCDPVSPTVAYLAVRGNAHCNSGSNRNRVAMYYGSEIFGQTSVGGLYRKQNSTIAPFIATADVAPIISHELLYQGNDVPIYFLTRDSNGNISHGFWQGNTDFLTGNKTGNRDFVVFSSGAFSN
jgi:hypothetical protein